MLLLCFAGQEVNIIHWLPLQHPMNWQEKDYDLCAKIKYVSN